MAAKALKNWYVEFPTYQYNEDVKAIAKDRGLRILDAVFDAGDGVKNPPKLTLKNAPKKPEKPEKEMPQDIGN